MRADKRKALEAAGWRFGDAADFLGMTDEERQLLDARSAAALAVRRHREAQKLTQKQLASRMKTSQPRVAKIEQAAADVSLDQILRAFAAVGGRITVKQRAQPTSAKLARKKPKRGGRRAAGPGSDASGEIQIELIRAKL